MKKISFVIIFGVIFLVVAFFLLSKYNFIALNNRNISIEEKNNTTENVQTIAKNLRVPWEAAFLPDGSWLVTERPGTLKKIGPSSFSVEIPEVEQVGEGGLLGLALHPNFPQNGWLYLYYTTRADDRLVNIVARFRLSGEELSDRQIIVNNIPAGSVHNGGRIAFGPDGYLYVSTGDSGNDSLAQDITSLAGKILRVSAEGSIPEDNPYENAVYSFGHRNPQGLTWDENGKLWATEHGRSGILSGFDELNLIEKGGNYGWPLIQGNEERQEMRMPIINSGPNKTWAPSGAAYHRGSIFFVGLRGQALYEYVIGENRIIERLRGNYGRLRQVFFDQESNFYLLTSNRDGRGNPKAATIKY